MDKIKSFFKIISLKTSFILYIILCLLIAILLSLASFGLCQFGQAKIYKKYQKQFIREAQHQGEVIDYNNSKLNGVLTFYTSSARELYSDSEKIIDTALNILEMALIPVWFAACIGITGILFYKRKLQRPLEILDKAADNITQNNLDFTIFYNQQDEMGKLCISFEKMREALKENNFEMWRQMEERKRLNAAFSHDLRTPLTVLKGQSEMLLKYMPGGKMTPEKILLTVGTMQAHIIRLENYVYTMNHLQKLEDIEIAKTEVAAAEIIACLQESGNILCTNKKFVFCAEDLTECVLKVDLSVVIQVYENILSNAIRFAKSTITITLSSKSSFSITVSDDGSGFTQKDLQNATNPFYKTDDDKDSQHFGLGLNICKILCEKHGGFLNLGNQEIGALVKAVF